MSGKKNGGPKKPLVGRIIPFPTLKKETTKEPPRPPPLTGVGESVPLTLLIPFPAKILPLLRTCLKTEAGEFGVSPVHIFEDIDAWGNHVLGPEGQKTEVNLPERWPLELELNPIQLNYFIEQVVEASWQRTHMALGIPLPYKAERLSVVNNRSHWLGEHPFARLLIGCSVKGLRHLQLQIKAGTLGAWEFQILRSKLSFDGFTPHQTRLAVVNRRFYQTKTLSAPCQWSKEICADLGGCLWFEIGPGATPEGLSTVQFRRMEE